MSRYYPESYDSLAHKMLTKEIARNSQARWGGRLIHYLKPAWGEARRILRQEANIAARIAAKEQEIADRQAELRRLQERA